MKNKKFIYLLIIIVLFVWGYIFYNIFLYYYPKNHNAAKKSFHDDISKDLFSSDTFSLKLNYADPFFTGSDNSPFDEEEIIISEPEPKPVVKPTLVIPTPKMNYCGIIKNKNNNKELIIIKINGKENTLSQDKPCNGITIRKIYRDSVEILYNNSKKMIHR